MKESEFLAAISLRARRVVVAESDGIWRESLRAALSERGAKVSCAGTFQQAVGILESLSPEAVVIADRPPELDAGSLLGLLAGTRSSEGGEIVPTVVLAQSAACDRLLGFHHDGAFSCITRGDQEATVAMCLNDLECALRVRRLIQRNGDLRGQLRRQNSSFGHIVRLRTKRLMEAYAELKRLDKMKLDLIALISHQIRTPLCTIIGNAELMRAGAAEDPQELEWMVNTIHAQGLRLARFVDDATAFLNFRLCEFSCNDSEFPLAAAVEGAHCRLAEKAEKQGVAIDVAVPPALTLRSDLDRLTDIVYRILDNAITYSSDGDRVTLRAWRNEDRLIVEIQDTGRGIAPAMLPYLFEPFELARDVKHHSDGNGMSLAISRETLKALGGTIQIHSEGPGCGCLVTIAIPAVRAPVPVSVA